MEGKYKYNQANSSSLLRTLSLIFILSLSSIFNCADAAGGHNYTDALSKSILFFEGQRSGKLPPDQRLRWRKDSALRDGSSAGVDLTGGYYDAGDNVKFGFPMAFTLTMLAWSVVEFGKDMGSEVEHAMKAVRWGTDYLLKATSQDGVIYVQVGDALSDHNCWERPEDMDTLRTVSKVDKDHPGSEVAGETAAALAAASIAFNESDPSYSKTLLDRAVTVFQFGDKYRGKYSSSLQSVVCPFYCNFNGYEEELLWGAAWLQKASKKKEYTDYIEKNMVALKAGETPLEFGWDNKHAGINVLLSLDVLMGKSKTESLKSFQANAEKFMCAVLPETTDRQYPLYSPGGLIAKQGGSNMQRVTAMSFLALAYSKYLTQAKDSVHCGEKSIAPSKLVQLAKRQVDYILGDNPNKMSYMVGYGPKYPQYIHHRASSNPSVDAHQARIQCKEGSKYFESKDPNPNVLVGAVVGGPNITDSYSDSRPYFEQTEPTTYINAPLVGLLGYFSARPCNEEKST